MVNLFAHILHKTQMLQVDLTEISWCSSSTFDEGTELVSATCDFRKSCSSKFLDIKDRSALRHLLFGNTKIITKNQMMA